MGEARREKEEEEVVEEAVRLHIRFIVISHLTVFRSHTKQIKTWAQISKSICQGRVRARTN